MTNESSASNPAILDRQIRVFISSTFRDMHAERDYLVKFVFPELRRLCESRGVTWGEVDLRWGVTDEQKAEGKVLPICLEEIGRCRPYFIGLLGERYGWIPEVIPDELLDRESWLREQLQGRKSVTELEIVHGVLREEAMHGHAYFYFRHPEYVEKTPAEERQDLASESAESAEKLRRLKQRIRAAREEGICRLREDFRDPEQLGDWIREDFSRLVNDLFPEGSQPDPLDREAMDHEAYAQSRERVYIGRPEYFARLDAHAEGKDDQPLVILGESGSGKSALLANWAARYRREHPDALVLQHYIGASPYSADWATILRRIMGEFKRRLGIQQDIPDKPDALRSAFPNWLHMASAACAPSPAEGEGRGEGGARPSRIVLILDALNQLEDRDGAPDLVWLPPVMPENVRLIVSTLPGRPLDEIRKRDWPEASVSPLDPTERKQIIAGYLAQSAKRLSPAQLDRIAGAPQSANPLYLRVLLDELRLLGKHEELDRRIGYYLQAESPYELYRKVIARWEDDYGAGTTLVGDTLSLLWAARRGLSESELLQALGSDGEPLPRAAWSPLFLAMADALVSRGGLLTFAHDFLRTAARDTYVPTDALQQQTHLRLAEYFSRSALDRRIEEYPHQLERGKNWPSLAAALSDLGFFEQAWQRNCKYEWMGYWTSLQGRFEPGACYQVAFEERERLLGETEDHARLLCNVGLLLREMGLFPSALLFTQHALEIQERLLGPDYLEIATTLLNLAGCYSCQGKYYSEALSLVQRALAIQERLLGPDHPDFAVGLLELGKLYEYQGDYGHALPVFQRVLALRERSHGPNDEYVAGALSQLAAVYTIQRKYAKALPLQQRVLAICERILGTGNPDTMNCLDSLSAIYTYQGRYSEALPLVQRALALRERVLGPNHPDLSISLLNLAAIYLRKGKYPEAQRLYQRAQRITEATLGSDHLWAQISRQNLLLLPIYQVASFGWGLVLIVNGIFDQVRVGFTQSVWGGIFVLVGALTLVFKRPSVFLLAGTVLLLRSTWDVSVGKFETLSAINFLVSALLIRKFWKGRQ